MEIHFYESEIQLYALSDVDRYNGWAETYKALADRVALIYTTQMGLLSTRLYELGYHIFVQDDNGHYEIRLGGKNTNTNREIKMGHNLFKMWVSGEFTNKTTKENFNNGTSV